jgi:hypothetical protein
MKLSYAQPAQKGVTMIMGVGQADGTEAGMDLKKLVKYGGAVAVGVWGYGWATKNPKIKKIGFGAAVALFLLNLAMPYAPPTITHAPPAGGCCGG